MSEIKELDNKVDLIATDVTEIKTALKGYNGQLGLCQQVEKNTKAIFKLWVAVIILCLALGGGTFGVVKAVMAVVGGA